MSGVVRDRIAALIAAVPARPRAEPVASAGALGYGVDLVCRDDLTDRLDETRPNTVESLAQDLYHRLITDRGTPAIGDNNFGFNVLALLASLPMTASNIQRSAGEIRNELLKDDRVDNATVTITPTSLKEFRIGIQVKPAHPELRPFTLILELRDGDAHLGAIQ